MADPNTPEATANPTVNPLAPPSPPAPETVAPPAEPVKPKAAYLVIEPQETLAVDETPDDKPPVDAKAKPDKDHIVATGALTVVMVKTGGVPNKHHHWNAVKLPKDAADLSVVEVHRDPTSTGPDVAVFPNKGESIGTLSVNDGKNAPESSVGVGSNKPVSFRKMSKALWAVIS